MIAGRYDLEREIGRGGSGVVWLAHDRLLDRAVALKQIGRPPGGADVDAERADREARLSASIRHPNIVTAFDLAIDEDTGEHWLVMEYVDGASLGQLVRDRGPMGHEPAARVMGQVADALATAHAAGITHRDVKPSNILLERDGTTKLTDFGIARTLSDPQLTQTGLLSGSPAYLAPEVASGQRGDMSADVWSWGATLFHLLAGHPPYDLGENVIGGLYRIVHDEPPRLSDAGPLAAVLAGTMTKEPADRWSMTRVRDELRSITGGAPSTLTTPVSSPEPLVTSPTAVLPTAPPPARPPAEATPRATATASTERATRRPGAAALIAVLLALIVIAVLLGMLLNRDPSPTGARSQGSATTPSTPTSSSAPQPTAAGMRAFIEDYVHKVADDPGLAWPMLTARFQRESGGFETYRAFWDKAANGTVSDIRADPTTLDVSYRPHFDHWRNSPNPTLLTLVFRDGHYFIASEQTVGFTPSNAATNRTTNKGTNKGTVKSKGKAGSKGHGKAKGHRKR